MKIREIACPLPAVELFHRLSRRPGCFFLDSAQAAGGLGCFSFLGCEPATVFEATGMDIRIISDGATTTRTGQPLAILRELLAARRGPTSELLPFTAGAVGGISYEAGTALEGIASRQPGDFGLPDLHFGFHDGGFAFDHTTGKTYLTAHAAPGGSDDSTLARLEQVLHEALAAKPPTAVAPATGASPAANWDKPGYLEAVQRIKDYIAAGDVYQVNLTQRFDAIPGRSAPELYLKLRALSPAPFACYYDGGAWQAVGCSPERFLRLRGGRMETRPIKGTRPRGATPEEENRLRAELLASAKDRAELLMIVDLERNDLGRICEFGSVKVDEACRLEEHPTVFHLVGTVSGRPRAGVDVFDCLRATLPGGSITGAPKIRAMQVINELEPVRRGFYTGAFGYLGCDGGCDLNIAIRTILCAGERASYHVGGGIVWDSDPESEFQESLAKGRALRAALMM
ncbi:MAG: aminodeoxychorismate synthase, component [Verrucomicrobiota bacterium]|jgi:para-aminobenzoate synthetase component 1